MAGLIRYLLSADRRAEKTAQRLYHKAVQRVQRRAKLSSLLAQSMMLDADEIAAELQLLLRGECYRVNLLDPMRYQTIWTAIYDWQPRYTSPDQADAQQRCGFVQMGLMALLPQLKRRQRLTQLCQAYRQHLVLAAAEQLKSQGRSLTSVSAIAIAPRSLSQPTPTPHHPASAAVALHPEADLLKIGKKIQAVNAMQQTLSTRQDVDSQYRRFQQVFQANRPVIEKERDSAAMMFVKAVVTVISVGLAALLGLWRVRGQKIAQQIDRALQPPISPSSA